MQHDARPQLRAPLGARAQGAEPARLRHPCCVDAGGICPQHEDKLTWPRLYGFYGGKRQNDDT